MNKVKLITSKKEFDKQFAKVVKKFDIGPSTISQLGKPIQRNNTSFRTTIGKLHLLPIPWTKLDATTINGCTIQSEMRNVDNVIEMRSNISFENSPFAVKLKIK